MLSKVSKLPKKKLPKQSKLTQNFIKLPLKETPAVLPIESTNSPLGTGNIPADICKLKISAWNVNGLRAVLRRKDFQAYIENNNPDILCLNETKIDQEAFKKEKISSQIPPAYYQYWNFCKPPFKGYSGVAILSKFQPLSIKEDIDIEMHSQEGRVLQVEFENFFLIVVYVPNAGDGLKRLDYRVGQFDRDFQNYINKLKLIKNVIVCGDLNVAHMPIDLKNPQTNTKSPGYTIDERNSFSQWLESGWVDTFRHLYPQKIMYSWWSPRNGARAKNIGWRIDYFVVSKGFEQFVEDSIINNDIIGSDHCPIELIVDISKLQESFKVKNQENVNDLNIHNKEIDNKDNKNSKNKKK